MCEKIREVENGLRVKRSAVAILNVYGVGENGSALRSVRAAIGFGRCPRVVSEQRFIVPSVRPFGLLLFCPTRAGGEFMGPRYTWPSTGESLPTLVAHFVCYIATMQTPRSFEHLNLNWTDSKNAAVRHRFAYISSSEVLSLTPPYCDAVHSSPHASSKGTFPDAPTGMAQMMLLNFFGLKHLQ